MPVCQYCGRKYSEGEVCACQQNAAPQQGVPYPNPTPQNPQNPQNPYQNQYQNPQDPNAQPQKKKMSTGCLIALIVGIVLLVLTLIVGGILAAILVPSMMGYVEKSKLASANSTAKTYYNAASTALCDMDVNDVDVRGTYMISSEGDMNVPFSRSMFDEYLENYLPSDEDGNPVHYDYVLVFENSVCVYAAVNFDNYVGVYPFSATSEGAYDCKGNFCQNADFNDIYQIASEYTANAISYANDD